MITRIELEPFNDTDKNRMQIISKNIFDHLITNSCCKVTSPYINSEDNKRVLSILKKLFERPLEEKLKFSSSQPLQPGFSPYGRSKALDTGIKNTLETWDIDLFSPINFPDEMSSDWDFLIAYQNKIFDLVTSFFLYLSYGIGVSSSTFLELINKDNGGIHFIHYLPDENLFPEGARRQSKHCDMTLITVIPAPSEEGLEVEINGHWVPIKLESNEFLIQVGLLFERMVGGKIKGCLHTVETYENTKSKHRYSFPYFVSPSGETKISMINAFRSEQLMQKYPDDFVKNINAEYFSKIFKPEN